MRAINVFGILILCFMKTTGSIAMANNLLFPDINCKKTNSSIDKLICDDPNLNYLHKKMSEYYDNADKLLSKQGANNLFDEQKEWLNNSAKVCNMPPSIDFNKNNWYIYSNCLTDYYKKRNYELFKKNFTHLGNHTVNVTGKIEFRDFYVTGMLTKREIIALKKIDLIPGGFKVKQYRLIVNNCNDLEKYYKYIDTSNDTIGDYVVLHMSVICSMLNNLNKEKPPRTSFLKDVKLSDAKFISYELLPLINNDGTDKIELYKKQGKIVENLIKDGIVKLKVNSDKSLSIYFNEMENDIDEIARGDFTGNGIESILVTIATKSIEGSYHTFSTGLITRLNDSSQFLYTQQWPVN